MNEKVCAARKSKTNPKVYSVNDLRVKAIEEGYSRKDVTSMNKKDLCNLLNIVWRDSKTITKTKELDDYNGRSCRKNKSKNNPNAYTKGELVELISKKFKITNSKASGYTKPQLCYLLSVEKEKSPVKTKTLKKREGNCVERSDIKLKKHQMDIVNYMNNNRAIAVAFETGTGKTLTAVTASQCFLDKNQNGKVIVVTPKSLQDNFKKEIRAYGEKITSSYMFYTFRKFATEYAYKNIPTNTMLVIDESHELRTEYYNAIASLPGKDEKALKKWLRSGKKGARPKPSISNISTAIKCAKQAKKVLLLTATPVMNKPSDVINLVAMIKGQNPMKEKYFNTKLYTPELDCKYFKNMFMFYNNKNKTNYPTRTNYLMKIPMTQQYYKEYKLVAEKKHHLWHNTNPHKYLVGMRQASNDLPNSPKYKWVMKLLSKNRKTLIYSGFKHHGIYPIMKKLDENKIKYGIISGELTVEERSLAVKQYNEDKIKILFITKAGGQGLDLKGTRDVVLLEREWNDPVEEQVVGRAIRYGSHSHLPNDEQNVSVYYLVLTKPKNNADDRKTADEILSDLIDFKKKENKKFINMLKKGSLGHDCK